MSADTRCPCAECVAKNATPLDIEALGGRRGRIASLGIFTQADVDAAVAAEREAIIKLIEGGRFLHDQAPTAKFAREVVAAIRRERDAVRREGVEAVESAMRETERKVADEREECARLAEYEDVCEHCGVAQVIAAAIRARGAVVSPKSDDESAGWQYRARCAEIVALKAEVERLTEALDQLDAEGVVSAYLDTLRERDDARAEVERLRASFVDCHLLDRADRAEKELSDCLVEVGAAQSRMLRQRERAEGLAAVLRTAQGCQLGNSIEPRLCPGCLSDIDDALAKWGK